jgi:hypothetical protein
MMKNAEKHGFMISLGVPAEHIPQMKTVNLNI